MYKLIKFQLCKMFKGGLHWTNS